MNAPERIWVDLEVNFNGPMTAYRHIGSWPGARHEYILATPEALAAAPEVQRLIAEAVAREREACAVTFVNELNTLGDSAVTEAFGALLCCTGQHCGCHGATVGEYVETVIAAAIRNRKETT